MRETIRRPMLYSDIYDGINPRTVDYAVGSGPQADTVSSPLELPSSQTRRNIETVGPRNRARNGCLYAR